MWSLWLKRSNLKIPIKTQNGTTCFYFSVIIFTETDISCDNCETPKKKGNLPPPHMWSICVALNPVCFSAWYLIFVVVVSLLQHLLQQTFHRYLNEFLTFLKQHNFVHIDYNNAKVSPDYQYVNGGLFLNFVKHC